MASGTIPLISKTTLTPNANWNPSFRSNSVSKIGGAVFIDVAVYVTGTVPNYLDKLVTIPEGYRPSRIVYAPAILYNGNSGAAQTCGVTIGTDGNIVVMYGFTPPNGYNELRICTSFVI